MSETIRMARFSDIPEIVRLAKQVVAESAHAEFASVDEAKLKALLVNCIAQHAPIPGEGMTVVADNGEMLTGMFIGMVRPLYECLTATVASNLAWYTDPRSKATTAMRMLDFFMEWADRAEGPVLHRYGVSDAAVNPDKVARMLERRGFRVSGYTLEKRS